MGTFASYHPPGVSYLESPLYSPDLWSIRPIATETMKLFAITLLPPYCLFCHYAAGGHGPHAEY